MALSLFLRQETDRCGRDNMNSLHTSCKQQQTEVIYATTDLQVVANFVHNETVTVARRCRGCKTSFLRLHTLLFLVTAPAGRISKRRLPVGLTVSLDSGDNPPSTEPLFRFPFFRFFTRVPITFFIVSECSLEAAKNVVVPYLIANEKTTTSNRNCPSIQNNVSCTICDGERSTKIHSFPQNACLDRL